MKNVFLTLFSLAIIFFSACSKVDTTSIPNNSTSPSGAFTAIKSGTINSQNGSATSGTIEVGVDAANNYLLHLKSDFKSDFGTGAVTLILSKTGAYNSATDSLISLVSTNGDQYYKISANSFSSFDYFIVYCYAAKESFGVAALKTATSTTPVGNLTVQRTGTFINQNGSPATSGTVQIGLDAAGAQWLKFGADFVTETTSGAAIVALSKNATYSDNTVISVGAMNKKGEQYYKVSTPVGNEYTEIIIWCAAAKIAFGHAPLK